jgi:hypothetical protein
MDEEFDDNEAWRVAKLQGIVCLPAVGSRTKSFCSVCGGISGSGAIRGRDEQWVDDLGLVSGYKASSAAQTTGAVAKLMGSFPI